MSFISHRKSTILNEPQWWDAGFCEIEQNAFRCVPPPPLLLTCLCFQRVRGAFESTGEGHVTPIGNSWGNVIGEHECVGMLCPDHVSLHFGKAAVEGRKAEAWHRPRLDFRWGGRKKRRPGCMAGAQTPPTGVSTALPV